MNLNFNQCLILLFLGFILSLIIVRALLGVVNRLLLGLFELKKSITGAGGDKPPTISQAIGGIVGGIAQAAGPAIGQKITEALVGKKPT